MGQEEVKMSDGKRPDDMQDAKPTLPVLPPQVEEELSEQELDNVNGGALKYPPGPPAAPLILHDA